MSAWIVSKKHIDALVEHARQVSTQNPNEIGQMLWEQNHRSVNHRYGEKTTTPTYVFEPCDAALTVIDKLKLIDCYEHQSCEIKFKPEVSDYCNRLRRHLITQLDGYKESAWGI